MDAIKIYENAEGKLERGKITLGEFERLIDPLSNVIPIPKGVTNGDIIKAMFPQAKIIINELLGTNGIVFVQYGSKEFDEIISYSLDWWNAPYKGVEE